LMMNPSYWVTILPFWKGIIATSPRPIPGCCFTDTSYPTRPPTPAWIVRLRSFAEDVVTPICVVHLCCSIRYHDRTRCRRRSFFLRLWAPLGETDKDVNSFWDTLGVQLGCFYLLIELSFHPTSCRLEFHFKKG
jgi:hypothetical protein